MAEAESVFSTGVLVILPHARILPYYFYLPRPAFMRFRAFLGRSLPSPTDFWQDGRRRLLLSPPPSPSFPSQSRVKNKIEEMRSERNAFCDIPLFTALVLSRALVSLFPSPVPKHLGAF